VTTRRSESIRQLSRYLLRNRTIIGGYRYGSHSRAHRSLGDLVRDIPKPYVPWVISPCCTWS